MRVTKAIVIADYPAEALGYDGPLALIHLCGVPLVLRCLYTLKSAGVVEVVLVAGPYLDELYGLLGDGSELGLFISYARDAEEALSLLPRGEAIVAPVSMVASKSFMELLVGEEGNVVALQGGEAIGVIKIDHATLKEVIQAGNVDLEGIASYLVRSGRAKTLDISSLLIQERQLKRALRPLCIVVRDRESWLKAKRALVFRTQKGLHITSYLNKPVEDHIVYHISERRWLSPNAITVLGNLMAFSLVPLFVMGYFLLASILAYVVGIIDGLDGKLARSRGFLTKLGHIEHSFDMLFEQTWYLSFVIGLYLALSTWWIPLLGAAFLVLDGFVRHVYMQFKDTMGVALTAYSDLDRAFARIDGRRNMYVLYMIISSALGVPLYALFAMCAHAFITALFYVVRAVKHMHEADRASGVLAWIDMARKAPGLKKLSTGKRA